MAGKQDPHGKPPETLRALHKFYQKASASDLANDPNVCDFGNLHQDGTFTKLRIVGTLKGSCLLGPFSQFAGSCGDFPDTDDVKVYEHADLPGLQILPSLLPQYIQRYLLSCLLHRDLSDPEHKTNVHFHHSIPYNALAAKYPSDIESANGSGGFSFFDCPPESSFHFLALDPSAHSSLTVAQFLNRKLRWVTLGGQYDWTEKTYPKETPPGFPKDLAKLTHGIFEHIQPQAAIVNVYSPGDTLSIHRDVSEDSDAGLVSISLGCDGIFIVGLEETSTNTVKHAVLRLRSGDGVFMRGLSRYAWHGVPRVLAGTCPMWLGDWPGGSSHPDVESEVNGRFAAWRGWMANKRINLNIRQMRD
ncbi:MAG: hypothetical protein Q9176_000143 [Flavoplaca citrina]